MEYARIGGVFIAFARRDLALLSRQAVDGGTQSNEKMMDETAASAVGWRETDRQEKCAMNDRRPLTQHSSSRAFRRDLVSDHTQLQVDLPVTQTVASTTAGQAAGA